ncbi:PTS lactose/cellobiose transporter subunit IIA [Listeria innocua]|uniref:PTS system lactose-specific EIIA component n=3 Tax=Listeria innocua TaxID=1642 RepID=A0A6B0JB54_LISIO|nr:MULTISPECIES: PTS lactose/cellobiose transporter subunit IIA [Listeria]MWW18172.1 PTS lactose/cellobiose transporter subunit IIA [Listeria monocytogenes]QPQ96577.1 PTS lactose/cellobiose transporter subunit IIA [Listeria welshimeri]EAA0092950.1 PTS lactose/cellobiose transporter subunit IIA [Listeria innocua]EAC4267672.1 PTS lactose/cellobiose transporter subunit IIA [Listeria innocua]EAD5680788.1 PTS lactose/cellobiose transporter subunit IIA [Listeria innocua]
MDIEKISFSLISLAGDSFSKLIEALQAAKESNTELVDQLLKEADDLMIEAHKVQTEMLIQETRGEQASFSVLLVHAQDTLMNTILASTLIREMIEMHQEMKALKKEEEK